MGEEEEEAEGEGGMCALGAALLGLLSSGLYLSLAGGHLRAGFSRKVTGFPGVSFQGRGLLGLVGPRRGSSVRAAGPEAAMGPLPGLAALLGLEPKHS